MTPENPEHDGRKPQPPSWWRDPIQYMQSYKSDPPITQHVVLPEKVAVKYLAELSGQEINTLLTVMGGLGIIVEANRSVDFRDAAKILRRYGIGAGKTG